MKKWIALGLLVAGTSSVLADAMRPMLTLENKLPVKGQVEAGGLFTYSEFKNDDVFTKNNVDEYWISPYGRYGLLDQLAFIAEVPYGYVSPKIGDKEQGFGDLLTGFQLRVYEDALGYPYILPYASVRWATGNEDKGLGIGNNGFVLGTSVGTIVEDTIHFIVDGTYEFMGHSDYIATGAGTIIWDLNEEFSLLVEGMAGKAQREKMFDGSQSVVYGQGGMCYKPIEPLLVNVYLGKGNDYAPDTMLGVKAAYSF